LIPLTARAQQEPPGCEGSGLGIALFVDKPIAHVGDTLRYSVLVYNSPFPACKASGIRAWIVTPDGVTNNINLVRTALQPGQSDNYAQVATYVIRAQDIVDGVVRAAATDLAKIHQNELLSDGTASQTVNTMIVTPCIEVVETCTDTVGETGELTYSGTVRNCGDVPLTNVAVTNTVEGASYRVFGPVTLAAGQSANFTASYRPKDPCGPVKVVYAATGTDQSPVPTTVGASGETACSVVLTPGIVIGHNCPTAPASAGGQFSYGGSVTNTGNVTLTNVVIVSDQPVENTVLLKVASLAPGAVAKFTGQFTAPANTCSISTVVRVTGTSRCGQPVSGVSSQTCPLQSRPAIVVTEACPTTPVAPGDTLSYTGTVRNSGDVTLRNVVVVSALPAPDTVVFSAEALEPGAVANFSGNFVTPLNTCSVTNTLTARANGACDNAPVSNSATVTCALTGTPAVAISRTCPDVAPALGGTLTYTATIQNTGNITLVDVNVVSGQPKANTVVFTVASLAPGESKTFTASFPVPANLTGCSITDTLRVTGRDKCSTRTASAEVTTTCPVAASPSIRIGANCSATAPAPGAVLTYTGSVTNTGDVALTNVVVIADLPAPGTVVARIATLAPRATANFTGSYTAPLDSCDSTVILEAQAQDVCGGTVVSHSFVRTCPLAPTPNIAVTKTCPVDPVKPGGTLVFTGTVNNTGNITLTNVVVVNSLPEANTPVFGPVTLAPGQGASFSGSFVVPITLNACGVTSTVTATGNSKCDGRQVRAQATSACPLLLNPALVLTTQCPSNAVPQSGSLVFRATLRNTGDVTLTNVVVVNNRPTNNTLVIRIASLAPGQQTNFTGCYVVPSNCCEVVSTLRATAVDACGQTSVSDTSTMVCLVSFAPAVKITKTCDTDAVAPGEEFHYSGTISNTGNVALKEVNVYSRQLGESVPVLGPISLSPGEFVPYHVRYVVPPDFCGEDTVTVEAVSMCGNVVVRDSATSTCPVVTSPGIAVQALPVQSPPHGCSVAVGRGSVANTGNATLTNVVVYCNQPGPWTAVAGPMTLLPGQVTDIEYEFAVPQFCNCCEAPVALCAIGYGRCDGKRVSSSSTVVVPLQTNPQLLLSLDTPSREEIIAGFGYYFGEVVNTGDITLSNVVVVSTLPNPGTVLIGPINLAPGESQPYSGEVGSLDPDVLRSLELAATGRNICGGAEVGATANALDGLTIHRDGNGTVLTWASAAGLKYRVEYRTTLSMGAWQTLGEVLATGSGASIADQSAESSTRFYRVGLME
jgi:uncharacterized repeat protein (TIGR01451 family)